MTFLNSIILYGIAVASIPVLIHLFTRRKRETIYFSSLRFLKILESKRINKIKLQQIILLILRTLIILLIVIAFSRPALKETSSSQIGSHIKTSSVIILDNSLSSMAGKGNEQLFDKIKNASAKIIDSFQENDQTYFIVSSDAEKLKNKIPVFDKNKSVLLIKEANPTYFSDDLSKIIKDAEEILTPSQNFNKEIYICSDLQNSNFNITNNEDSEKSQQIKRFILTDSQFKKDNASVENINIRNQIFKKNKEIEIEAKISNYNEKPVTDLIVNLYLDGRRTAQKTLSIDKRFSDIVGFSVIPEKSGFISGFVEIENDLLEEDNRRYFDLFIPEKIKVLLISNKDDSQDFIKLALNPINSDSSLIQIRSINQSMLSTIEIDDYEIIILNNVKNIANSNIYRMKNFLSNGKSLMIFPGSLTDIDYYNKFIAGELNLPNIISVQDSLTPEKGFISFGRIDIEHTIFSGMFEKENLSLKTIESPHFYNFFTIEKKPDFNVIIELSNGNPFLGESFSNGGRIIMFTSAADPLWSDFPYKGIFAPIINQAVFYLANETYLEKYSLLIGGEISFLSRKKAAEFNIEKPDGSKEKAEIKIQSDNYIIKFNNTDMPGIYKLFADENLIKIFSVNIDPKESDLFKPNEDVINSIADKVIYIDKEENIPEIIRQSRFGREIGKFFLITALILLGLEMWIERDKNSEET
ncbi:BatA domain-containing protein [candidate division KSB1 bacterium]